MNGAMTHERHILIFLAVFGLMVSAASMLLVAQRGTRAAPNDLTPDMQAYIQMSEGSFQAAPLPAKHRVLLPALTRLIPGNPRTSLALLNYVAFVSLLPLLYKLARTIGIEREPAAWSAIALGLLSIRIHEGPFLTDIPAMFLTVSFLLAALWTFREESRLLPYLWVLLTSAAMTANRELSGLLFLSTYGSISKNRFLIGLALISATFLVIRAAIPGGTGLVEATAAAWSSSPFSSRPAFAVLKVVDAFGFLWPWFICGAWWLARDDRFMCRAIIISASIATISSLLASDTSRMFTTALMPFAAIGSANFFSIRGRADGWMRRVEVAVRYGLPLLMAAALVWSWKQNTGFTPVRIFALLVAVALTAAEFCSNRDVPGQPREDAALPPSPRPSGS